MNERTSKLITAAALLLSSVVTFYSMFRSSGGEFSAGILLMGIWSVSPYLFVFSLQHLTGKIRPVPKMPVMFIFVSLAMLGFTVFAYLFSMDGTSSTEALAYLFVPVYLYLGAAVLLAIGFTVSFFVKRSRMN